MSDSVSRMNTAVAPVDEDSSPENNVVSLDLARANKFLDHLAADPFVCIVRTDEGELHIFSKDMPAEQMERIKDRLSKIEGA